MKPIIIFLAIFFTILSLVTPPNFRPWITYNSELFSMLSLISITLLFVQREIKIPVITLPILLLALVPFFQLYFGQVFYFSIALMGFIYLFCFWLSMQIGYNLSTNEFSQSKTFKILSYTLLFSGILSSIMSILQWTNLESFVPGVLNIRNSQRPFANFAQPNNMATFLIISLMSCLYLYEKKNIKVKWLFLSATIIIVGIALSQSRTAWVAAIAILLYLAFYQYKGIIRLKWYYSTAWFIFFIACIVIFPLLSQLAAQAIDTDVVQSRDVVSRATGDMSRLAIWQQMLAAIQAQPWFGYGWYQTSVAFVSISDTVQGPVWIRSAHNFILDFLLWNGLLIGLPFLAYFGYLGYQLQRWVSTPESVSGMLMIGAFVIHSMFEFPQHYAYFLLIIGFIIGGVITNISSIKTFSISKKINIIVLCLGVILLILINRDYSNLKPKLYESINYENQSEKITNQQPIYLLTEFNHRIDWIRLNPYTKVSPEQILEGEQMVLSYPTKYNLIKYAKLLAFNGYENKAKHQLQRLKVIQKTEMSYEDLTQDIPR